MSDDTDDDVPVGQASSRRKIKKRILSSDSSTSSTNSSSPILRTRRNANYRVVSDDSDSDSSDSFSRYSRKRKKVALITSDTEDDSDSSDSIIVRKAKRVANIIESDPEDQKCTSSQWETEESEDEEDKVKKKEKTVGIKEKDSTDYDSGGGEECPICLVPIRRQELGSPESCDHLFCLGCILEWSKNVNTCPIDRQEYRLVFVKDRSNGGKILRRIPIEKPAAPEEPPDDPICCEICGSGDREDRLLLCDGCDLGFHLECLTPALTEVPLDAWYCNACRQDGSFEGGYSPVRFVMPDEGFMRILRVNMGPRRTDTRMIPRTSQTERVISRILNHRSEQVTERAEEQLENAAGSSSTGRVRRKNRTKRRKKTARRKYRTVYEVDEKTGEVVSKKKQVRVRKRRRRTQTRTPKTVKKRLAQQLGICNANLPNQSLPDVRIPSGNDGLTSQRYQAGIPTLHLFGQRDELDYFSASEEDLAGPDYLVRRRANQSDVAMFRRAARRKGVFLPTPTPSTSSDLLGSILNSQSRLFSKDVKLSVDDSGKFRIEKKGGKPDLSNSDGLGKKTPYGGNNRNQRRNNQYSNPPYQRRGSYYPYDNYGPSSTSENYNRSYSNSQTDRSGGGGGYDQDMPQDYTQSTLSSYDRDSDPENSQQQQRNEQDEDSDIDIYSDIEESVSTSKIDEDTPPKPLNLAPPPVPAPGSDQENNDSENEMVIDTEKAATPTQDEEDEEVKEETAVTSSEDTVAKPESPHSTSEPLVQSSREEEDDEDEDGCPNFNIYSTESINLAKNTDVSLNNQVVSSTPLPEPPIPPPELIGDFGPDDVYDPEFSYDPEAAYNSEKESEPPSEEVYDPEKAYDPDADYNPERQYDPEREFDTPEETCDPEKPDQDAEVEEKEAKIEEEEDKVEEKVDKVEVKEDGVEEAKEPEPIKSSQPKILSALYSDSEDEEVVKISQNSFIVGDISTLTEDVSEEERSYTPCLDEKASENKSKSLEDLGTEMISDDEKNDFDESHEHKTASEGDALEINAKESEIDMIKPEDYEEGEIVDKNKANKEKQEEPVKEKDKDAPKPDAETEKTKKKEEKKKETKEKQESFKKLSKSNKERNYRDKEKGASHGKEDKSKNKENSREKRKRKEIERYDVRALIAEKPRRLKDKFGRDIRKSSSKSRSRSYTPKISPDRRTPPKRRSSADSRERKRKKRSRSRRRSSESRSKSRQRHRSPSRSRRRRSRSRSKRKKKPKDASKRRKRERSASRTYTPTRKRRKDWRERGFSAEPRWTPSLSRSPEADQGRHATPSWTPPRTLEPAPADHRGLTVILQNDQNKKKKDKRKKSGKKGREVVEKRTKRKKKDQTPPPSKEVFASGDNILVSVSFNKENERRERDVFTKKKKEAEDKEKKKRSMRRKKKNQELSTIKPVAIIDLERSPFRELTPSPKDIIVLSDEDHVENNATDAQDVCDSSQQVASPENAPVYMTGPKTPPEPQVKFSLPSKQPVLRPLSSNPLHDPEDDVEPHDPEREEDDEEEEEEEDVGMRELSETHKGPNTPPEPPNSPPSSPDAYDPFEPTKSRSPSPVQAKSVAVEDADKRNDASADKGAVIIPSLTPPLADVQPADSQSSLMISRDSSKSPERGGAAAASAPNPLTSTPMPSSTGAQRINILSSTILGNVSSSSVPQRGIVLPNVKLSPVKASPAKNAVVVKSTPVKGKAKGVGVGNNESGDVISLDFDSPYSPGSSDYEDLFEPPPDVVTKKTLNKSAPVASAKEAPPISSSKPKNAFDSLFDTPVNKLKKIHVSLDKSKGKKSKGTKIVGVKLDEDHLKILDELPNSAVEMQVKDKFLKKLNRQERVVEEVKLVLKPYYNKKKIDKEEYKDIMRRAVPKICHNRSGEINPTRIKNLIEAYVKKIRHSKPKVTSSSSYNLLKG